jgi:hypothetical protein
MAKLCNKFDLHSGFMQVDQVGAKKCCQMGRIGCAILQVPQKGIVGIQVFSLQSFRQVDMKTVI